MKKTLLACLSLMVLLVSVGCTTQNPVTRLNEPLYFKGNVWTWNGTAYQLVNTNLGGNSTSGVPYVGATQNVNLGAFGLTATGVTDSSLTNVNAVVLAGAGGALTSTPNLVYQAGYLSSNAVKVAAITTGQVVVAGIGTQGTLGGSTNMSFDVNTGVLSANIIQPNANLSSTANQTSGGTTVANNVTFNSNDQLIQITHSTSTNTSQIWMQSSGAYLVTFSAVVYASAVNKHVDIWFAKNGVNVSNSNTRYELPLSGESLVTVTTIIQLAQADYIELKWASTDDASMKLLATPTGTSPTRPASPSVILTINKISS